MVGIIDYGTSNLRSVQNALSRINVEYVITNDAEVIKECSKLILPDRKSVV